jgi:hypothetical protein
MGGCRLFPPLFRTVVDEIHPAQTAAVVAFALLTAPRARAASFTINNASTTAQTLGPGSGQTGEITETGSLTVGGSTVAVTISGNNATLINIGAIDQTGTGRAIRDNTGVTGLTIYNGCVVTETACGGVADSTASIRTTQADVIQMNKSNGSLVLNYYGEMISKQQSRHHRKPGPGL